MSSLVEFKHEFGAHSLVNDVVVDSARCYLYDTVQASTAFFKDWKVSKKDREFLDSVTFFYEHSFKGCPYFSDIRQDGTYEKTCPFSGQALVAASHNYKVIHVPLVGLRRVCCKSSDIKVENIVSTFFKPINREMGPYDFFDSTNVETPGLNTPDSKLPDHMSSLSITYSKELTKLIVSCDLRDRHKSRTCSRVLNKIATRFS